MDEQYEVKVLDEHELLDLGAKAQIVLNGLKYAVMFQDLDTVRKCVIDLHNCVIIMDEIVEGQFGTEE